MTMVHFTKYKKAIHQNASKVNTTYRQYRQINHSTDPFSSQQRLLWSKSENKRLICTPTSISSLQKHWLIYKICINKINCAPMHQTIILFKPSSCAQCLEILRILRGQLTSFFCSKFFTFLKHNKRLFFKQH